MSNNNSISLEKSKKLSGAVVYQYLGFFLLALLIIIPTLTNKNFRTINNLEGFLQSIGVLMLLAMGESFVLFIAGIDLSVGAALAMGSIILSLSLSSAMPLGLALVLTILSTMLIGVVNGFFVAYLRIPSFIVTFGTMGVEESIALLVSGGNRVSLPASSNLPRLATGMFLHIPYQIWLVVVVLIISSLFLRYLKWGQYLYACGSNLNASRLSGVPTTATLMLAYIISGLFAGLASIVYTARIISGDPIGGSNMNTEAITAAVIGGVSLLGGRGTLWGACIGAIIYSLITNVLNLYGVNPNITEVTGGIIILVAAYANVATVRSQK